MPTVTVIIPTHARPQYLLEAVDSVLAQTFTDFELIVVDDGSPEPATVPSDPRVCVVRRDTPGGPGAARNTGLEHAAGEFVLFLDDDDLLTPRRLSMAMDGIGTAEAHAAAVQLFYEDGRTSPAPTPRFEGDLRRVANRLPQPSMGQVVHRRRNVQTFDESLRLAEDTEWWIRMSDSAVFAWTDELGLRVRVHEEDRVGVAEATRFHARAEIARRHKDRLDRRALARRRAAVAGQALVVGYRWQAVRWSVLSLAAWPSTLAVKQFASAIRLSALPGGG